MAKTVLNILQAIATGDIRKIIDVVATASKRGALEASERAHAKGIEVSDGRPHAEQSEGSLSEDIERWAFDCDDTAPTELLVQGLGSRRLMWRSIHTAPRNGGWILLSGGSIGFAWDGETQPNCVVGQYASSGLGEPCWQFARYDNGHYDEYEAPTHWMPLPDAVPVASDNGPGWRYCVNALASPADLEIIERAFPPGEEWPEFDVPRF